MTPPTGEPLPVSSVPPLPTGIEEAIDAYIEAYSWWTDDYVKSEDRDASYKKVIDALSTARLTLERVIREALYGDGSPHAQLQEVATLLPPTAKDFDSGRRMADRVREALGETYTARHRRLQQDVERLRDQYAHVALARDAFQKRAERAEHALGEALDAFDHARSGREYPEPHRIAAIRALAASRKEGTP